MNIKNIFLLTMFSLASLNVNAGWNGAGEIHIMYIYPEYAVIVQGNTGSGPNTNCTNDGTWSFSWSQFDEAAQNRIYSTLLSAYISKSRIQIVVDGSGCGPENKKKFTGQIQLP
jgi:hypothetical protein